MQAILRLIQRRLLVKTLVCMNGIFYITSKVFALYQKGQCKEGCKQMQEAMHIFDVLGLPEQVAYYQEHYEKFVKD